MKQNFKRTMALLLMTAMLSSLAVVLSACFIKPGKIPTGPNHTFDENNVCTSCGYFETGLEFILNVDDASYSVSGIGTFTGTDVVIPRANLDAKPVTGISYGAFSGCDDIITITIPDSVTSIGGRAFYGCTNLTSVTIPDSVTSIGEYAFYGCTNLTSVTIPDNVTDIGRETFSGCTSLTSITIPDNVTNIGYKAFSDCTSLTSIIIPDSVTSIGNDVFSGCLSLESITIPFVGEMAGVTSVDTYQYPLGYIFGTSRYTGGVATKQSYYGSSTSSITQSTYYIPSSLKNVTVTGGNILYGAFSGCSGLTSITIPDNVTSIGGKAFFGCSGLTNITIPDSVTSIGESAFYGTAWYDNQPDGLMYAGKVVCGYKGEMPNGTEIVLNEGTLGISDYAFYTCTNLSSITIPDSVINIGESAFYGCKSLTSITIPDSVTSIGGSAFSNCSDLTSIIVSEGNSKYHSTSNCIIETESKRLIAGCSNSVIPSDGSVTSIGHGAFSGCSDLTSIIIPDNATSIGDWAFANCTRLTTITIPDSVTSIGERVFHYCRGLTKINYNGTIEQWSAMTKGSDWDSVTGNYTVYCSDGNIQK